MTRRVLWAPLVVVVSLIAAAVVAEGAVRLYGAINTTFGRQVAQADPLSALIEPHGDLGYRQRPNARFRYPNGTVATANGMGFRGPTVAVPKPAGTFRIVLLGESSTHGWGVNDDQTIDASMRRALAERFPTRRVEVVNLAFDGYDSYQLYQRLATDGLALDPDVIIVNSGINDVRNARYPQLVDRDPRTLLFEENLRIQRAAAQHQLTWWAWWKHHTYLARLPGMIRGRVVEETAIPASRTVTPNPKALDLFALNLRRIADLAGARGVPVLFSTPPSSIPAGYSPASIAERSYFIVDVATTQHYRDLLAERMRALAAELGGDGRAVRYLHPQLPSRLFLDDCHPSPEGNRLVASNFVRAVAPLIEAGRAGLLAQHKN